MHSLDVQISLSGQKAYAMCAEKYGKVFADAVIDKEVQLHADNIDIVVFEDYAKYDWMQEFKKKKK